MHEATGHSVVSEALVRFATAALLADQRVQAAAARAVAEARAQIAAAGNAGPQLAALLQSQGSRPDDTRVRSWILGATLATHASSPSSPVLAAVIAMGDKLAASADEIAAAAAIGIETAARVLAAADSEEFRARWNVSSAVGVLGATLAVSRLLKLDEARTRHALGIAATQAAGLSHNSGQAMAALETGKAAADAIEASLLAKHGFTSAPASIDGRRGFAALMTYRFDTPLITEGLGTRWISFS